MILPAFLGSPELLVLRPVPALIWVRLEQQLLPKGAGPRWGGVAGDAVVCDTLRTRDLL